MWLLIHAWLKLHLVSKSGPESRISTAMSLAYFPDDIQRLAPEGQYIQLCYVVHFVHSGIFTFKLCRLRWYLLRVGLHHVNAIIIPNHHCSSFSYQVGIVNIPNEATDHRLVSLGSSVINTSKPDLMVNIMVNTILFRFFTANTNWWKLISKASKHAYNFDNSFTWEIEVPLPQ